jgi:hypothetical protein
MLVLAGVITLLASSILAESKQFKQFERDYDVLHQDLLNHEGEVAQVTNFVFSKDIASFTFMEGEIHFQRYVNGRPTTAIFIGTGRAQIKVPSHVERRSLLSISGDSTVDATFTTCFIRMADDFDLKVKEKFPCKQEQLRWSDFNIGSKKAQGEYFFKPVVFHSYDNYFQLLRSAYERGEDGYFYVKFNRYGFSFDPNRSEEVRLGYQFEGGDIIESDAVVMQRQEHGIYDDSIMSNIEYPAYLISKQGLFEMGGADGRKILKGEGMIRLRAMTDSLKFLSLFLDRHLKIDSIRSNGRSVEYFRRKDFNFVGGILPEYVRKHDTFDVTFWYTGADYYHAFPWTEDPRAVPHGVNLITEKSVGYLIGDSVEIRPRGGNKQELIVTTSRPYGTYFLLGTAYQEFDTTSLRSDSANSIHILFNHRNRKFYLEETESVTLSSFNFYERLLGPPSYSSRYWVSYSHKIDMPGVIAGSGGRYDDYIGGLYHWLGQPVARQWFPKALASVTYRETWLFDALPVYLDLMLVQEKAGSDVFYNNLLQRRDILCRATERGRDLPLAVGSRAPAALRVNKGIWLIHMLRWLLYDLESQSEENFRAFLRELSSQVIKPQFTNNDFVTLAEKYYRGSLESFFRYWLYGTGMPEYNVNYQTEQQGNKYFITAEVTDKCSFTPCQTPVMVRVVENDRVTFVRQVINGSHCRFTLGPFATKPTEFHFNEFFSVLSLSEVNQE